VQVEEAERHLLASMCMFAPGAALSPATTVPAACAALLRGLAALAPPGPAGAQRAADAERAADADVVLACRRCGLVVQDASSGLLRVGARADGPLPRLQPFANQPPRMPGLTVTGSAAAAQVGRFVQAHLHSTWPHLLAGAAHALQELLAPGQHAHTRLHAAAAVGAHLLAERSGIELASVTGVRGAGGAEAMRALVARVESATAGNAVRRLAGTALCVLVGSSSAGSLHAAVECGAARALQRMEADAAVYGPALSVQAAAARRRLPDPPDLLYNC
jgi:hypothetical protein